MSLIKDILYIIEGYIKWGYYIITGKVNKLYKHRLLICDKCKHNKYGVCNLCGCIIKAKVKVDYILDENGISIDGCQEKKW